MKTEDEIREKLESINEDWDNANDIWEHYGANPEVGAVCATLHWVLEEDSE